MRFLYPLLCAIVITVVSGLAVPRVAEAETVQWKNENGWMVTLQWDQTVGMWKDTATPLTSGGNTSWIMQDGTRTLDSQAVQKRNQGQTQTNNNNSSGKGKYVYSSLDPSGLIYNYHEENNPDGTLCAWMEMEEGSGNNRCYPVYLERMTTSRKSPKAFFIHYTEKYKNSKGEEVERERSARISNPAVNDAINVWYSKHAKWMDSEHKDFWDDEIADAINPLATSADKLGFNKVSDNLYEKDGRFHFKVGDRLKQLYKDGDKLALTDTSLDADKREKLNSDHIVPMKEYLTYLNSSKSKIGPDGKDTGWGTKPDDDAQKKKYLFDTAQLEAKLKELGQTVTPGSTTTTNPQIASSKPGTKTDEPEVCSQPLKAICTASRAGANPETQELAREQQRDKIREKVFAKVQADIEAQLAAPPAAPLPAGAADPLAVWHDIFNPGGTPADKARRFFAKIYDLERKIGDCEHGYRATPASPGCTDVQRASWAKDALKLYETYITAFNETIQTHAEVNAPGRPSLETEKDLVNRALEKVFPPSLVNNVKNEVNGTNNRDFAEEITAIMSAAGTSDVDKIRRISEITAYCGPDFLTVSGYFKPPSISNPLKEETECPGAVLANSTYDGDMAFANNLGAVGADPAKVYPGSKKNLGVQAYLLGRAAESFINGSERTKFGDCLQKNFVDSGILPGLSYNEENKQVGVPFMLKSIIPQMIVAEVAAKEIRDEGSVENKVKRLGEIYAPFCENVNPSGTYGERIREIASVSSNPYAATGRTKYNFAHGERGDVFPSPSERAESSSNRGQSREINRDALFKIFVGLNKDLRNELGCKKDTPAAATDKLWKPEGDDLLACKIS